MKTVTMLFLIISLTVLCNGCISKKVDDSETTISSSKDSTVSSNNNIGLSFEILEKYYDYIQSNNEIIALLKDSSSGIGFSDDEMAAFTILGFDDFDYTVGKSKDEFNLFTEKYFAAKIKDFNNSKSMIIPETDMVTATGWSLSKVYMVLKNLEEDDGKIKKAEFYTVFAHPGDEWSSDTENVKKDMLSGNLEAYGPVYLMEVKFIEKYDENGEMYFQYISIGDLNKAEEPVMPYGIK